MLSRPGPLPSSPGWSYEVKWDGFRAIVSTEDGLRVRSRRGWDMTDAVPELDALPREVVFDGELVAWQDGGPWFPDVCHRVLNRDFTIPLTFVVFDLLRIDGEDMRNAPFSERRAALERLGLNGPSWATSETFDDGDALFRAVCEHGLEGVMAKRLTSRYGPNRRGWIKTKNPNYAAQEAAVEVARLLLDHGAAVDCTNRHGNTPLFTAVFNSRGDGSVIELLRASGRTLCEQT
jgi:bifunctional non-homologous end joining protein LigD